MDTDEFGGVAVAPAPPDSDEFGGAKVTAPSPAPDVANLPQLSQWNPTLADKARMLAHEVRTSRPVEALRGRTPEEIAAAPALDSASTTHDAGAMGVFSN